VPARRRHLLQKGRHDERPPPPDRLVNTFIVIGIVCAAIASIVAFVVRRSQRGRGGDLGEVSSQWLIEHRGGAGYDMSRWSNR
jgi:hypothetical protein